MKSERIRLTDHIDNLQSTGRYWLSRRAVMKSLGMTKEAFTFAIHRLVKKARICRIRDDFYTIVPLEYKSSACLPPSWFIDTYMKSCNVEYYVALLSAAALHGAAHQQPMKFQVITNKKMPPIKAGRTLIQFHFKKNIIANYYSPIKTSTGYMNLSNPTVTVCDLLRYLDAAGQINNVATIILELQEKLNIATVTRYAETSEIEVASVQRLGYLLDHLKLKFDLSTLIEFVQKKQPHYRELVVGSETAVIEKNKRWRILVNENVEPDILNPHEL